ncbi:hypothetical protein BU23DRAFT_463576, partial [Bimuria novae-zelandiae CBS 107.79]
NLKRTLFAYLPTKLASRYLEGTLLHIIELLYGIAEVIMYHRHHCKELDISTLIYYLYLLVTNGNVYKFSIINI